MTTFGICMVKDEADIIGETVTHMLTQVDEIIVADNLSTDDTIDMLMPFIEQGRVTLVNDTEPAYLQSQKMTALAVMAMARGADWIVPFDADEYWYSPFADRIGDVLDKLDPKWDTASAAIYDHVATRYDKGRTPHARMVWRRRNPLPLVKVACRAHPELIIEAGNHGAKYPGGTTVWPNELIVRHFPYRSKEQFVRKARNGAAARTAGGLPDDICAHWRGYGAILDAQGPEALHDVFHQWFYSEAPADDVELIYDPVSGL